MEVYFLVDSVIWKDKVVDLSKIIILVFVIVSYFNMFYIMGIFCFWCLFGFKEKWFCIYDC